jgi:hypothetical protein
MDLTTLSEIAIIKHNTIGIIRKDKLSMRIFSTLMSIYIHYYVNKPPIQWRK